MNILLRVAFLLFPLNVLAFEYEPIPNWVIRTSESLHNDVYSCYYSSETPDYIITIERGADDNISVAITHPTIASLPIRHGSAASVRIELDNTIMGVFSVVVSSDTMVLVIPNTEEVQELFGSMERLRVHLTSGVSFDINFTPELQAAKLAADKCIEYTATDEFRSSLVPTLLEMHEEFDLSGSPVANLFKEVGPAEESIFEFLTEISDYDLESHGIKFQVNEKYGRYSILSLNNIPNPDQLVSTYSAMSANNESCSLLDIRIVDETYRGFLINYIVSCNDADKPYILAGYNLALSRVRESIDLTFTTYEDNVEDLIPLLKEIEAKMLSMLGSTL